MADFGLFGSAGKVAEYGAVTASSDATDVTPSATSNTKGSYTELTSATTDESNGGFILTISHAQSAIATDECDYLIDIAIGGAGSEQVIVPNLLSTRQLDATGGWTIEHIWIPVNIPSGARVAARCQASGTLQEPVGLIIRTLSAGFKTPMVGGVVDAYGATTASSTGIDIDPGATINTKGSYSEITSSTTRAHKGIFVMFSTSDNNAMSSFTWLFDVAIGGAGSEQVICENIMVASNGAEQVLGKVTGFIPVSIPEGARIAVRAQCSGNNAADRVLDCCVYGVS